MLQTLPLSSSGKVDRHALPAPSRQRPALAQAAVAPRTTTEKMVAALWCEHLQLDEVGIDDGFFELGGQSLLLVRIQNALSKQLGREIAIVRLLQHPTVRALAADIDKDLQPEHGAAQALADLRLRRRQGIMANSPRGGRPGTHAEGE